MKVEKLFNNEMNELREASDRFKASKDSLEKARREENAAALAFVRLTQRLAKKHGIKGPAKISDDRSFIVGYLG